MPRDRNCRRVLERRRNGSQPTLHDATRKNWRALGSSRPWIATENGTLCDVMTTRGMSHFVIETVDEADLCRIIAALVKSVDGSTDLFGLLPELIDNGLKPLQMRVGVGSHLATPAASPGFLPISAAHIGCAMSEAVFRDVRDELRLDPRLDDHPTAAHDLIADFPIQSAVNVAQFRGERLNSGSLSWRKAHVPCRPRQLHGEVPTVCQLCGESANSRVDRQAAT